MLGAIAGDIIGSVFEWNAIKTTEFPLFSADSTFTDDTVLTIATADAILHQRDYAANYKRFGRAYPHAGYGGTFRAWLANNDSAPYNSWGNGSAMRVSPIGFAYDSLEAVLTEAANSAMVTHNHPEGVKGAQATAAAIFWARNGLSKTEIRREITARFQYRLDMTLAEIRPSYSFDVSCQGSVPQSILAFLESDSVESAIAMPCRWAATPIRWPALRAALRTPFIKRFRQKSANRSTRGCRKNFGKSGKNSSSDLTS